MLSAHVDGGRTPYWLPESYVVKGLDMRYSWSSQRAAPKRGETMTHQMKLCRNTAGSTASTDLTQCLQHGPAALPSKSGGICQSDEFRTSGGSCGLAGFSADDHAATKKSFSWRHSNAAQMSSLCGSGRYPFGSSATAWSCK